MASIAQDFRHKLVDGKAVVSWSVRRRGEDWLVRQVTYGVEPDRIEEWARRVEPDGSLNGQLDRQGEAAQAAQAGAEAIWKGMTSEDIAEEWVEIERQWRPETLAAAFDAAGFDLVSQHVAPSFGVPHIFSVFQRRL